MIISQKWLAFIFLMLPPTIVSALSYFIAQYTIISALSIGILSSFAFCDVWYFLRLGFDTLKLPRHESRKHLFAISKVYGRVGLMDIDRNGHYNNARFLRECGFGRRNLWQHNGIWRIITAANGNLVVGSQSVRYRRELSLGQAYIMETRLICWDKRAFYVEHRFVTKNIKGDFVNAIVFVKNTVLGALTPMQIVAKLPALQSDENVNPPMRADIVNWIASNEASSQILRAEAAD
ncbi:Predicted thioesterase [Plasmopara halstedii]|uniref:Predicted thioesterase n=1 Tax=Plasmopara halstedii TaxID=4781 RepID=A0A0N7L4F4_PLAHL|nr:Predicted thioesterase [Plasmopara halstedii]CEG38523.1 Predicted thioesterase [Plasmopara halstedii]|eukprot:XP_024574892.1 Predicted thioesterase [Plasmopara halstedii]